MRGGRCGLRCRRDVVPSRGRPRARGLRDVPHDRHGARQRTTGQHAQLHGREVLHLVHHDVPEGADLVLGPEQRARRRHGGGRQSLGPEPALRRHPLLAPLRPRTRPGAAARRGPSRVRASSISPRRPHRPRHGLERVAAGPVEALHLRRAQDALARCGEQRAGAEQIVQELVGREAGPHPVECVRDLWHPANSCARSLCSWPRAPRRPRARCGPASPYFVGQRGGPAPPRSDAAGCGCPGDAGPWRRCRRSSGPAAAARRRRRGPRRRDGAGAGGYAGPGPAP